MSTNPDPLRLAMFVMPVHDPQKPLAQCFDEDIELALQCEELGFGDFWVGEHHSSIYENIVMPEIFLGKVLGMTERIRVGPAPVCLQYHDPVHVAGRLAFLDHLSHGRLNLCFGPGAVPTDMEVFGADPKDSGARVAEAIDMILGLWSSDPPYEFEGRFWRARLAETVDPEMGIGELHKPLQRPYPPIWVPGVSRASRGLAAAAARGFKLFSHHMVHADVLEEQWDAYRGAAAAAGRTATAADWCVARNVLVADTTAEARRLARGNSMGRCIEYILELTRRTSPTGLDIWKPAPGTADADVDLDYFMDEVVIAGDPDEVARRLLELRGKVGEFGTLSLVAHDWDDAGSWRRSHELMAREVLPRLDSA